MIEKGKKGVKKRKGFVKGIVSAAAAFCMLVPSPVAMFAVTADAATAVYGDVNNDGVVDIGDVIVLSKFLNGKLPASSINKKYADVDKNTVFDVNDCQTILAYLVNKVPSLPYSESGSTFNYNYTVPVDAERSYYKYDTTTRRRTEYRLSKPASVSALAGDSDNRFPDTSNNAQCIVQISTNQGTGTGFIVSDHVIATAGHCLYNGISFINYCDVLIYNAEGTSVVNTIRINEFHVPTEYVRLASDSIENNEFNYDYGLIYVEEDLSAYGSMPLGLVTNEFENTSQRVNVSGFPAQVANPVEGYARYYGYGNINGKTTTYQLQYTAFASSGDSGGPVYIEYTLNGSVFRSAIGIHTFGAEDKTTHGGTRITLPLLRFYNDNPNIG